ncbi:hypothetical protein DNL40_12780 [Xylanimonas oleitrophica]|uniref:Uncharacterized protein n=1 Tax=Xylanimonas oleitrophica TaxID=2607479 RepID=A0A2W5WWZ0_9MICO|nr:hypothetical protein [Xylanimonas oleitrophica]PZR52295.1 hypothetical protein DNL40_12780 [Xylanimonas oleitrophica]
MERVEEREGSSLGRWGTAAAAVVATVALAVALVRIWNLIVPHPPGTVCSLPLPPPPGCDGGARLPLAVAWTAILAAVYLGAAAWAFARPQRRTVVTGASAAVLVVLAAVAHHMVWTVPWR